MMIPYIAPEEEQIFTNTEELAYIVRPFLKEYVIRITSDSEIQDYLSLKLLHTAWEILQTSPKDRMYDFDMEFFMALLESTEEYLHDLSHHIHTNPTSLYLEDIMELSQALPEPFYTIIGDSYGFRDGDSRQPQEIMALHHVSIEMILHAYTLYFGRVLAGQIRK